MAGVVVVWLDGGFVAGIALCGAIAATLWRSAGQRAALLARRTLFCAGRDGIVLYGAPFVAALLRAASDPDLC